MSWDTIATKTFKTSGFFYFMLSILNVNPSSPTAPKPSIKVLLPGTASVYGYWEEEIKAEKPHLVIAKVAIRTPTVLFAS